MTELLIDKFKYLWKNQGEIERFWILPKGANEWQEIMKKERDNYGGWNWQIDPNNKNHRINTIIRANRIDTFYRMIAGIQNIYYKKQLPKVEEQEFSFDFQDIIERDEMTGKWVYKHKPKQDF